MLDRNFKLDVGTLSSLFRDATNSYKYLFLIAILERIQEDAKVGKVTTFVPLKEIVIRALQFGWYPHHFFRLKFGERDQVSKILNKLDFEHDEHAVTSPAAFGLLYEAINSNFEKIGAAKLLRYAPSRLIAPFFKTQLKGVLDSKKDNLIEDLSRASFEGDAPPVYRFTDCGNVIELHLDWYYYFSANFKIVRSWVLLEFSRFLQLRNPDIPAIPSKLEPPQKRGALLQQKDFWREILSAQKFQCIYSDNELSASEFHLDHFLPWSFVCHDELWNLIPADPSANLSKGRVLPRPGKIDAFINVQERALVVSHSLTHTEKKWFDKTQSYCIGLSLSSSELLSSSSLRQAYRKKLTPLIALATQLGY